VEPDADSEAIFWDVRVLDETAFGRAQSVLWHYMRIKIFNDRGRNQWSTVTIPIPLNTHIWNVAARTIHPDGSVVDLDRQAIHEQNERTGNTQVKRLSFAMPGVEAGSIIEYRYREVRELPQNAYLTYAPLDFHLNIPAQIIRYWIRPHTARDFPYNMLLVGFQCPYVGAPQPDGYYLATLSNVPAFRAEPRMPPRDQIRPWVLLYYRPVGHPSPQKYWSDYGRSVYNEFKGRMKVSKELQSKADEITSGARTDEAKLSALSEFCRSHIRNIQSDAVSAEEREGAEKNKNPADTLNQEMGTSDDIRFLFASLAAAAGFDARLAKMANRNQAVFYPAFTDPYFLRDSAVAVKLESRWRFYEPEALFIPNDMIASQHEGVPALISDPKEPVFVITPPSRAEQTVARQDGHFRLDEDGTLEGDLDLQFTGHFGTVRKGSLLHQSGAQRQESLKNEINQISSTAEVSEIRIENDMEPEKPIVYHCHVRVAGYAQRTGKRLFFAPEFFRQSQPPVFPEKERKYPVYIPYAYAEEDHVTIEIPAGFVFDAPKVPAAISMGDAGRYEVKAQIQERKRLVYTRRLTISYPSGVLIPVSTYPALKNIFDQIAYADKQTLALKQASAAVSSGN
jgi:Domain of Unknown Function with PDB structure (DUF3857)